MKATIITIGDEILIGQIVDTNSVSIAKHLNAAGIVVREKLSIGDDRTQIVEAVGRAMSASEVTVITGGLGPTKDDITKKTLAEMFRSEMRYDQRVAGHVEKMLAERGIEFNELNRSQAMVPACCTVLFNAHGTAPGMWFERDGHVAVSLPGVPFEMEHLMEDEVMPRLKARFALAPQDQAQIQSQSENQAFLVGAGGPLDYPEGNGRRYENNQQEGSCSRPARSCRTQKRVLKTTSNQWQRKATEFRSSSSAPNKERAALRECPVTSPPRTRKTPPTVWSAKSTIRSSSASPFTVKSNS